MRQTLLRQMFATFPFSHAGRKKPALYNDSRLQMIPQIQISTLRDLGLTLLYMPAGLLHASCCGQSNHNSN